MLVLIPFRYTDFIATLVSFCRDDPRYDYYVLIEEKKGSREGAGQQRRLHQLLKLPHSTLVTGKATCMSGVMGGVMGDGRGGKTNAVECDEPEHQQGDCGHPAGDRDADAARAGIAIEPFWGLFIAWHPLVSLDQYGRYHFM
jgi:hypothetical protein